MTASIHVLTHGRKDSDKDVHVDGHVDVQTEVQADVCTHVRTDRQAYVIVLANHKGGVTKTTSNANLGALLAEAGRLRYEADHAEAPVLARWRQFFATVEKP